MKAGLEIAKWLYGLVVSSVIFLFFCLFLDAFCYLIGGGWQPLLGQWPIFSGSISILYFGDPWKVIILILGISGLARIIIGKKVPDLIDLAFTQINSKGKVKDEE